MKPLDFVRTPKGNIAIITETTGKGSQASISFIGEENPDGERNAWWGEAGKPDVYHTEDDRLIVIDSLSHLLSRNTAHPFGHGRDDAKFFFGIKVRKRND